jgi:hypothetical protein
MSLHCAACAQPDLQHTWHGHLLLPAAQSVAASVPLPRPQTPIVHPLLGGIYIKLHGMNLNVQHAAACRWKPLHDTARLQLSVWHFWAWLYRHTDLLWRELLRRALWRQGLYGLQGSSTNMCHDMAYSKGLPLKHTVLKRR